MQFLQKPARAAATQLYIDPLILSLSKDRRAILTRSSPRSGYDSEHNPFQNQQSGRHYYAERSSEPAPSKSQLTQRLLSLALLFIRNITAINRTGLTSLLAGEPAGNPVTVARKPQVNLIGEQADNRPA